MASDELGEMWVPQWTAARASILEWRRDHPRATMREIEEAVDEQMDAMRAQMLGDVAVESASAKFAGKNIRARPVCQACGCPLISNGAAERTLTTTGGREVHLRRSYARCPGCGLELFPPR